MRRKQSKKIWALFTGLAVMLSLFTGTQTHAEEQTGSIIVHKLKVEKESDYNNLVNDLTNRGTGNEITDGTLDTYEPFEGISFTLTKVKEKDGLTVDNAEKDTSFAEKTLVTDADGLITFDTLPLGTYKLEELNHPEVKTKMATVLIEIPTYNPEFKTDSTKDEWLYNVHVYPKNLIHQDGPSIDKDVMEEGNNHGSVDLKTAFPWIITTDIPVGVKDAKEYKVLDTLDSRLDFVADKGVSAIIRKTNGTEITLQAGTDYDFTSGSDNRSLVFDFKKGLTRLADAEEGKVVITFHTMLNTTADLGTALKNSATLIYTNKDSHQYKPGSDDPEVHSGGVSIKKVDKDDPSLVLSGAKFRIYQSEADALAGTNPVMRDGAAYEVISGVDGMAVFYGLAYGNNGGSALDDTRSYWIVETQAPVNGDVTYNRLLKPFEVTVTATSHTVDNAYEVKNASKNFDLPFTGGNGIQFYIGGGILLLAAGGYLLLNGRKKGAEK